MFSVYNSNQKYKGRTCLEYLTANDLKRNDYISNFYKQHPSLAKDSAMAIQMLLFNKDITEEDRQIFTEKLNEIRRQEEMKMKELYRSFKEREAHEENKEMDEYIDKDKDIHEIELK